MKVRSRLLLGFAVIIVILWAIILVAATNIRNQASQLNQVKTDVLPGIAAANGLEMAVTAAYDATMTAMNPAMTGATETARAALAKLPAFEPGGDAAGMNLIDPDGSLRMEIAKLDRGLTDLLDSFEAGKLPPPGPPGSVVPSEPPPPDFLSTAFLYETVKGRIFSIETTSLTSLQANSVRFTGSFTAGNYLLIGSAAFLTLTAIAAAVVTSRSIVGPLRALREGTEKIAAGDLDYRVGTEARDEIGELSRSFDGLTRNLVASTASVENLYREITARQQVEAALRESEEKLRTLLEVGTDGYLTVNLKGKVTSCNEAFGAMIGMTAAEATGQDLSKLPAMTAGDAPRLKRLFRNVIAGKATKPLEVSWEHPDGRRLTAEFRTGPLHGEKSITGIQATVTDITVRKRTEQELKESEERLQTYLENAPDGIILSRLDGAILYCNGKAEELFGYRRDEIIGRNLFQLNVIPDEHRPTAVRALDRTRAGKPVGPDDLQLRQKDGSVIWLAITAAPMKHQGQSVVLGFLRDVSERKQEEDTLRQEREKAQHYLDVAGTMLLALDTAGRVTMLNRKGAQILGWTEQEAIGRSWFDTFIPASNREEARARVKELLRGTDGQVHVGPRPVLTADGEEKQVAWYNTVIRDPSGKVTGTLSSGEDVTERLRTESALRTSDAALKSMHDAIVVMDRDFHVIEWNSICEELFGVKREKIVGRFVGEVIYMVEDHPGQNEERVRRLEAEGFSQEEQIFRIPRGDIWVDVHIQAIEDEGQRTGWVMLAMDITERKLAEEKLRRLDEMKLEFLSNVSHELRTPLQSISGFTKLLLEGEVPDQQRQQEFLSIIDGETVRLQHLINGLLDMSRLETGKFRINRRPVAVDKIMNESVAVLRSLASSKDFEVTLDLPAKLPAIEADPDRLHQVLLNLLGNAIKFSDPGSNVTVRARRRDGNLLVQVLDNGSGITEADREHLFERFYRGEGEKAHGGSGLGLYISRQIVEAHGGRIWMENRPGGGSTFSFTLPLTAKGGNGHERSDTGN
jgi:PAS domain S-box-containing protein